MTGWRHSIAYFWRSTRLLIGVLSLVRFQLIVLAIGLVLVLHVDQVRDLILAYSLQFDAGPDWPLAWLLMTMMGCALVIWYSARVMLRFRFEKPSVAIDDALPAPSDKHQWPRLKQQLPRVLGALVFVIFLIGLGSLWRHYPFKPVRLSLAVLGLLLAYIAFVLFRRRWLGLKDDTVNRDASNLSEFKDLPLSTRVWYWSLLAANVGVMLVAINAPHAMARGIGPGAVLALGASLIVVAGSTLVYWSNWFRFPVVIATLAVIAFFSLFNENHLVRRCPGMTSTDVNFECPAPVAPRPEASVALERWVAARKDNGPLLPLFIVAAEGGGIRAAYWTAAVLSQLQDESPASASFGQHVFAISGVSGGSLGAATFAAMLQSGGTDLVSRSSTMLSRDFLGPTLATLIFPDLLQRIVPVAVFNDRAMTLEKAWERAWRAHESGDAFGAPFESLWAQNSAQVPLLFMNSTVVETGERMIYAPVRVNAPDELLFAGAVDGGAMLGRQLPLSTVVHNTARFPYLSPAGLLRRQDVGAEDQREHWARLVDGGYFDNSAALTAVELLALVLRHQDRLQQRYGVRLMPYVIRIRNSDVDGEDLCDFDARDPAILARDDVCQRRRALPETLSPLYGVLNVRAAHTRLAVTQLEAAASSVGYKTFALHNNGVVHPLGWMLAEPSRRDMRCQVTGYEETPCRHNDTPNKKTVHKDIAEVLAFLGSATEHAF